MQSRKEIKSCTDVFALIMKHFSSWVYQKCLFHLGQNIYSSLISKTIAIYCIAFMDTWTVVPKSNGISRVGFPQDYTKTHWHNTLSSYPFATIEEVIKAIKNQENTS